jgi:23S rRNA (cytosine1962-C5)-methyltransferase
VIDHGRVDEYELLEVGDGRRLERFGSRIVLRPHPGADGQRGDPRAWDRATLAFVPGRGWTGSDAAAPWPVSVEGLTVELRPTATGQLGLFPEQAANWAWLRDMVAGVNPAPTVLNLFGYTGVATLVAAAAGASVVHVDAARPAIAWARHNAALSGLADRPIRWIVDDAATFAAREVRRGRRYDGIVLDPPSYGHGAGHEWRIERDLDPLIADCARLIDHAEGFVLLTAHTPGFGPDRLAETLAGALEIPADAVERGLLSLTAATGRTLDLGAFTRWSGAR